MSLLSRRQFIENNQSVSLFTPHSFDFSSGNFFATKDYLVEYTETLKQNTYGLLVWHFTVYKCKQGTLTLKYTYDYETSHYYDSDNGWNDGYSSRNIAITQDGFIMVEDVNSYMYVSYFQITDSTITPLQNPTQTSNLLSSTESSFLNYAFGKLTCYLGDGYATCLRIYDYFWKFYWNGVTVSCSKLSTSISTNINYNFCLRLSSNLGVYVTQDSSSQCSIVPLYCTDDVNINVGTNSLYTVGSSAVVKDITRVDEYTFGMLYGVPAGNSYSNNIPMFAVFSKGSSATQFSIQYSVFSVPQNSHAVPSVYSYVHPSLCLHIPGGLDFLIASSIVNSLMDYVPPWSETAILTKGSLSAWDSYNYDISTQGYVQLLPQGTSAIGKTPRLGIHVESEEWAVGYDWTAYWGS